MVAGCSDQLAPTSPSTRGRIEAIARKRCDNPACRLVIRSGVSIATAGLYNWPPLMNVLTGPCGEPKSEYAKRKSHSFADAP